MIRTICVRFCFCFFRVSLNLSLNNAEHRYLQNLIEKVIGRENIRFVFLSRQMPFLASQEKNEQFFFRFALKISIFHFFLNVTEELNQCLYLSTYINRCCCKHTIVLKRNIPDKRNIPIKFRQFQLLSQLL